MIIVRIVYVLFHDVCYGFIEFASSHHLSPQPLVTTQSIKLQKCRTHTSPSVFTLAFACVGSSHQGKAQEAKIMIEISTIRAKGAQLRSSHWMTLRTRVKASLVILQLKRQARMMMLGVGMWNTDPRPFPETTSLTQATCQKKQRVSVNSTMYLED